MRDRRSRRGGDVLFGSAGWLFADLMLAVVVMVLLAAVTTLHKPPVAHPPQHHLTVLKKTPPVTTPTAPPELLPQPIELDVEVDSDALLSNDGAAIGAMLQGVRGALAGPLAGRRVGVVLTFGTAPSGAIQRGVNVATQFNNLVLGAMGGQFTGAAYRAYFQGGGDLNKVSLEIFVFDR
jgi:hypothetical protein